MTIARVLVIGAAGMLAGCSAIDGIFGPQVIDGTGPESTAIDATIFVLPQNDDVVGELQVVRARQEDTFVDIARHHGLGFDELVSANPGVDPWLPGAGTEIVLPTRFVLPRAAREGIVLNVAAKRLFYFPPRADGEPRIVRTFPVGIGRAGWATPTGDTTVVSRARDPVWFVPASVRAEHAAAGDPLPPQVPPGPDNPLGAYVLGLQLPGYLIHGTNKPAGVGMRVSHGCVRLFPEHIEWLYDQVEIGERVRIVNQPFLFGWSDDDLLFEAHRPLEEDRRNWTVSLAQQARSRLVNRKYARAALDEDRITRIASDLRGFPVSALRAQPDAPDLVRSARRIRNEVTVAGEPGAASSASAL